MVQFTPGDKVVHDSSKCMTLVPCADAARPASCVAESLNQQLDGAIPRGVGFDGLKNPGEIQLVLAFYQPLASSDTSTSSGVSKKR